MTNTEALIAARRAQAQRTHDRALQAIKAMTRAREPITFTTVAARAGVSREFLYRQPELADTIRAARRGPHPLATAIAPRPGEPSVLTALREHIRRLEASHAEQMNALRSENARLRQQYEQVLGQLLTHTTP